MKKDFIYFFRQVDLLRFNYLSPSNILATTMLLYTKRQNKINYIKYFLIFFSFWFFFFLCFFLRAKQLKKMCDEYRQRKYDAFCEA